jgi:hypothetical protein
MKLDAGGGELDGSWRCGPRLWSKVRWGGKKRDNPGEPWSQAR